MTLYLQAEGQEQQLILQYLEQNATETLADKINNGTPFEKDGKPLINKKTLSGFMQYACKEARKLAEKGATGTYVDDPTVYGWAMHFFEEDSIEGTLYTIDGEEYKPAPKQKATKPVSKPPVAQKPEPPKERQWSIFDNLDDAGKPTETETVPVDANANNIKEPQESNTVAVEPTNAEKAVSEKQKTVSADKPLLPKFDGNSNYRKPTEAEAKAVMEELAEQEYQKVEQERKRQLAYRQQAQQSSAVKQSDTQGSEIYRKYMEIQERYPDSIVAYRLGDFYEIFGENAVKVSKDLDLTLTGRECGLESRIPMVGFPYHASDNYINKLLTKGYKVAVVEKMNQITVKPDNYTLNTETGEICSGDSKNPDELTKNYQEEALLPLLQLFDGDAIIL